MAEGLLGRDASEGFQMLLKGSRLFEVQILRFYVLIWIYLFQMNCDEVIQIGGVYDNMWHK